MRFARGPVCAVLPRGEATMWAAGLKTFAMVTISVAAFMASPMAFPFVLITVFLMWATPFAIAGLMAPGRGDDEN